MIEAVTQKHGIHVRAHKNWNTKTIYNNGHVMRIYRRQPKLIRFQSPMVNDFNQHLCGGWSMWDIKNIDEATIQQLMSGKKPLACITYWSQANAHDDQLRLASAGFVTDLRRRELPVANSMYVWDLLACHDISVKEIGDLRALRDDYNEALPRGMQTNEIMFYADRILPSFFDEWDSPPLPLWLTGLILGYPVENTISIYLERHDDD